MRLRGTVRRMAGAAMAATILVGTPAPASADSAVDKAVAAVDAARRKANSLSQEANEAETALANSADALAQTQADLDASTAAAHDLAGHFRDAVIFAYTRAGFAVNDEADINGTVLATAYLKAASGESSDNLDALRAANLKLDEDRQRLASRLSANKKALATLQARQAAVVAQLGTLNRAVADARRQEQEAIAAAARASAAEKARAQALADAATARREQVERAAHITGPSGPWTCPVQGPHSFSNDFGAARYGGGYHRHQGNDILAPRGTPVVANVAGTFSRNHNGLGGNSYFLSGDDGNRYYGAHLDSYSGVAGGRVSQGTVLGYVGNTGDARGGPTHLHFEVHPGGGGAVNPYPWLSRYC